MILRLTLSNFLVLIIVFVIRGKTMNHEKINEEHKLWETTANDNWETLQNQGSDSLVEDESPHFMTDIRERRSVIDVPLQCSEESAANISGQDPGSDERCKPECNETYSYCNYGESPVCICNTGYTGNGTDCKDLDECKTADLCPSLYVCVNCIGSYKCVCNASDGHFINANRQCVKGEEKYSVEMRINEDYHRAYANKSSREFHNLSRRIENAIDSAYRKNGNYLKTHITSFRPGSVIANIELVFQTGQHTPLQELKSAITDGRLGDIPVYADSIAVIAGDKCSSKPCSDNATCVDLKDGQYSCTCMEGFTGNGTYCEGFVRVNVSLIVEKIFTEELKNKSSPEYQDFTRNVTTELSRLFEQNPNFVKVVILEIRNGSIIIDFEVVYRTKTPTTKIKELYEVTEILQVEAKDGFVRNLPVTKQGFVIKEPPPPPTGILYEDVKESQILIKWDPPIRSDLFSISLYLISYHPVQESSIKTDQAIPSERNVLLRNLKSNTFYNIYLRGKNKFGEGENSTSIQVKTAAKKSDSQMVIIIVVVVIVVVLALTFGIACLIAKQRRNRQQNIRKRETRHTGTGEIALSFSDRPYPEDWRSAPSHLRRQPHELRDYQNIFQS